ncbi:MAG: LmbU family transcriptional regulator [Conexibacter sp.]
MLTDTAWIPGGDLQLAQWLDYGRRLGTLGRGVAWWIGDWLLYGNERYGEKYVRAARVTGYDVQSLMNMSYVASRFACDRRREKLSWSHHAELASLAPPDQDRWLDLAEAERLSVHSLRLEVRAARRTSPRAVAPRKPRSPETEMMTSLGSGADGLVCPKCMHVIDPAACDRLTSQGGPDRGSQAISA